MKISTTYPIPLGLLLTSALAYGLYVSTVPPAVAVELTWANPAVDWCYVAADGFIVEIETDGEPVLRDTVWTNSYQFSPPPGTHRFRVLGFSTNADGMLNVGMLADGECVSLGDTAWSDWSYALTVMGAPGQVEAPQISVGVK
ncbi:hypothetical protein KAU11_06750 [Candidatus Babeliales bacterium]|nr:hypothetical protein [Candidatus Babeliales bacterium]